MIRRTLVLLAAVLSMPATAAPELTVVGRVEQSPARIAVLHDGTILAALSPHFDPTFQVGRLAKNGRLVPWPNEVIGHGAGKGALALTKVVDLTVDTKGRVWLLDAGGKGRPAKLLGWDTKKNALAKVVPLPPPATVSDSELATIAVDAAHHTAFVADPAGGTDAAILVVDLSTGAVRRVLQGDRRLLPTRDELYVDGRPILHRRSDGTIVRPRFGVTPLALDPSGAWLYFGPMNGRALYRVPTAALRDAKADAASKISTVGRRPICESIVVDEKGNVYLGDVGHDSVGYIDPKGAYHELAHDPRLSWVGGLAVGPHGALFLAASQLQRSPYFTARQTSPKRPFHLFRVTDLP